MDITCRNFEVLSFRHVLEKSLLGSQVFAVKSKRRINQCSTPLCSYELKLICICRLAFNPQDQVILCELCSKMFHVKCLHLQSIPKCFVCLNCMKKPVVKPAPWSINAMLPSNALKWGGSCVVDNVHYIFTNTCPIDNFIYILHLHNIETKLSFVEKCETFGTEPAFSFLIEC